MRKHDIIDMFPPELVDYLEYVFSRNRERNLAILNQVEEINAALDKKGVQPVYLKGVGHLLDGLYDDPGERLIGDIDFLVQEENYPEAADILKGVGYKYWWLFGDVPEWHKGIGVNHHYHILLREDTPVPVELHLSPVSLRYAGEFTADAVLSRKKDIADRKNCSVPCDDHKIVHNFIHGQLVNKGYRLKRASLRNIYDLYLIAKRSSLYTAIPEIKERDQAKAKGYFLFAASVLGLNHQFYSTENKKAKRHCFWSRLSLQHPRIGNSYRKIMQLGELIFRAYLGGIIKAVYDESSRKHIIRRVKDPRWFRSHLKELKKRFFASS